MSGAAVSCATCGWIVTDAYVDDLATTVERSMRWGPVSKVFVRCPECWVPIREPLDVDEARRRIRHAHDDLGDGGVCTRCGRLHAATVLPPCERCGGPDWSQARDAPPGAHHHCPATTFASIPGGAW